MLYLRIYMYSTTYIRLGRCASILFCILDTFFFFFSLKNRKDEVIVLLILRAFNRLENTAKDGTKNNVARVYVSSTSGNFPFKLSSGNPMFFLTLRENIYPFLENGYSRVKMYFFW